MPRYADPFICPDCSARLPVGMASCPSCGLLLSGPLASELLQTLQTADRLLARLRTESAPQPPTRERPAQQVAYPVSAPAAPPPARIPRSDGPHGMSTLSVPKILLSLGALCLLVAAVIFLAVAWSWLGVGGRTAVLVGLTLVSGGLAVWLGRRGLRIAAESLITVSLGLLAIDVVGADDAGWLGDLSNAGVVSAVGGTVLVAALALAMSTRLTAPQVLTAIALSVLGLGILGATERPATVATGVVLAYGALVVGAGRASRLQVLVVAAIVGAVWWWLGLALVGLAEATDAPSLHRLWIDGNGVALLVASLLLLAPVPFVGSQPVLARSLGAAGAALLTVVACLPATDESGTVFGTVVLVALAVWTIASLVIPDDWRAVAWASMLMTSLPVLAITVALAIQAAANVLGQHGAFTQSAGVRLADADAEPAPVLLVLSSVVLVAAVASLLRPLRAPWPVVGAVAVTLGAIGTLALYPVPVWTVVVALAVLGVALVSDALRRTTPDGVGEAVVGVAVATAAIAVAAPSAVLATAATAVVAAAAGAITARGRFSDAAVGGGLLVPVSTAGFLWCALEVAGVPVEHRGVSILIVVGLVAIALPRPEIEGSSALAAVVVTAIAVPAAADVSVSLAVQLTVAGVLVSASALVHPARRDLGWLGGLLLAAATWVRLADLGVEAPEAYTLPSAVALLVVGLSRLRRDPGLSTGRALTAGLLLATVPSLVWVLVDPVSVRAALLGAACLGLVLAGSLLRWSAPLLVGAATGTVVVLRELAPYTAEIPQWVLIGVAGTILTVVGVTWESRLRDVRRATAYVGRLR